MRTQGGGTRSPPKSKSFLLLFKSNETKLGGNGSALFVEAADVGLRQEFNLQHSSRFEDIHIIYMCSSEGI